MTAIIRRRVSAATLASSLILVVAACGGAGRQSMRPAPTPSPAAQGEAAAIARARTDSLQHPYTKADIDFMTGMIAHHAQAIIMAKWAPSHGASPSVRTLCARIINAQRDEIWIMQGWLQDRNQPVPVPDTVAMTMPMGSSMDMALMPGMLTGAQMDSLDQARGPDFDRLFLTYMIQHHTGAISMVKDLFASYGAAEDELTFKLASNINVDQATEIARMQRLRTSLELGIPLSKIPE
ncbi:MAG TPA: DUF305 domain-containing protein [Gemmatimonadales bacterium]|nr:DUF305 domain-containing protein [Gemmatimonadales bacterium]